MVPVPPTDRQEWNALGKWFCKFRVASFNVRWMIQIPRLYHVWRSNGSIANFQVRDTPRARTAHHE